MLGATNLEGGMVKMLHDEAGSLLGVFLLVLGPQLGLVVQRPLD